MNGHFSDEPMLHQVLWPDATLEQVMADYDSVALRIRESTGRIRTIRCEGHIGYALCGFWDEVIIERAEVRLEHPFLDLCVNSLSRRLGHELSESGNVERNTRKWKVLLVHLSDGSCIEVAAAKFAVD
jgi:hypothetical protein